MAKSAGFDFSEGYTTEWHFQKIDKDSWSPVKELEIAGFDVDCDGTDSVPLLETGNVEIDMALEEEFEDGWYMISAYMYQASGDVAKVDVSTLWFESISGTNYADHKTVKANGKSTLYPASTYELDDGTWVPRGVNGAEYAAAMLRKVCAAPVNVEGAFTINDFFVFDLGSTVLEAVWTLLDAGGFCIQLDGDGTINIRELPTQPAIILDTRNAAILGESDEFQFDKSSIPNMYTAYNGVEKATASNYLEDSPTSIQNRGFIVTETDTSPVCINGETLQAYCDRKLDEARTQVEFVRTYNREYWPGVKPFSKVRWVGGSTGAQDLTVRTQTLTLEYGILVKETAVAYIEE